jgi:hypothetical protein
MGKSTSDPGHIITKQILGIVQVVAPCLTSCSLLCRMPATPLMCCVTCSSGFPKIRYLDPYLISCRWIPISHASSPEYSSHCPMYHSLLTRHNGSKSYHAFIPVHALRCMTSKQTNSPGICQLLRLRPLEITLCCCVV